MGSFINASQYFFTNSIETTLFSMIFLISYTPHKLVEIFD